jgi:hypothetical protein
MNRSQTKIRKIQEANKIAEERFLMSEQVAPVNPVANKIAQPDPTKKPVSNKLPTDYNKAVTFLFPDNTIAVVKPQKQDVSKIRLRYKYIICHKLNRQLPIQLTTWQM